MRIIIILILLPLWCLAEGELKIVDGDTIYLDGNKIRFSGIDTPEINQMCKKDEIDIPCGEMAKELLIKKSGILYPSVF